MKLIWDYESGFVIDAETGEVIDTIYDYWREGTHSAARGLGVKSEVEHEAERGLKVLRKLKAKGLKDVRGTYVAYKIGISKKTVKSLKPINETIIIPPELKDLYEHFFELIDSDPLLSARPESSKKKLALAAAMVVRGYTIAEASRRIGINERTLRKGLKLLRSRA